MSKLARALALAAMLAAMNLAGMTAVAHAHPVDPATDLRATAQQQSTGDAALRRVLARERFSIPDVAPAQQQSTGDAALRRVLARERFSIPDVAPAQVASPMRPAEPGGQPSWLTPALSVLAAVLALVAGVAVVAARRAHRSQRAGQTA
jgi:hypothetical protein